MFVSGSSGWEEVLHVLILLAMAMGAHTHTAVRLQGWAEELDRY